MTSLSREQNEALMAGIPSTITYSEVQRPSDVQVPDWCSDAYVEWMDEYSNSPGIRLKTTCDILHWPDIKWRKEGNFYRAYHPDGRLLQYSHNGAVTLQPVRVFETTDGKRHTYRPFTSSADGISSGPAEGSWVDVEMLCTSQQSGFGGSNIHLPMEDGTTIVLRGPWHTIGPEGYREVAFVDMSYEFNMRESFRHEEGVWHRLAGIAGMWIRNDVFIAIMSKYMPSIDLLLVTQHSRSEIQPCKPEWGLKPKAVYREIARQAKQIRGR